ncbi:MAG: PRC-barrel domain-containing protein [Gemmatimonadaceae bacterium]
MTDANRVTAQGVEPLSRMPDCELAEGAPDVREWEVTSPTSVHLGVVKDLLIDLASMHVRYLDVALGTGPAARRVLIPIGKAWINDALDQVVIAIPTDLDALPEYEPASFNRDFEHNVLAGFGESGGSEADFYSGPAFDGARFHGARCGRRETDTGGDACPVDGGATNAPEAANGVELPVVTDAAAD